MTTKEKQNLIVEQIDLQNEIVATAKINIVNCGNCGSVFLHRVDDNYNVLCPYCHENMAKSDCPDFLYTGLELSGEFEVNTPQVGTTERDSDIKFERIGWYAKSLSDDGALYQYEIDSNDTFYIDYGNGHLVESDIEDYEILEIFNSTSK